MPVLSKAQTQDSCPWSLLLAVLNQLQCGAGADCQCRPAPRCNPELALSPWNSLMMAGHVLLNTVQRYSSQDKSSLYYPMILLACVLLLEHVDVHVLSAVNVTQV